jgi:hypothetical protein
MRGVIRSFLLASICVACSDLGGLTGGSDAPANGPGTGGKGGGGEADECSGDQCLPEPADAIYVAEGGNDTNDGKTPGAPKKTIGGAIALLKTTGAPNYEIHVCRGTYRESVTLDYSTSIRGGFECNTWKRADGNETIVEAPEGSPALAVKGVAGVTVEGLTLRASDAGAARSVAVLVAAGGAVKLTGDRISAAGGKTKLSPASAGVYLENGGSAEIEKSFIEGGSAANEGGGYGSAGIAIAVAKESEASTLKVVDSDIRGGSGSVSSGTGSIGILGLYGSVTSVERNVIDGGTGKSGAGTSAAGAIISSTTGDLAFIGNKVNGGNGSCTGGCTALGVSLAPKGKATVHGNRIIAGEVSAPGFDARFVGLGVNDAPNADIQNNQIFTGNTKHVITAYAGALDTRGLGTAIVGQNTLVLGSTLGAYGSVLTLDAKQGTVANNLFLGAGGSVEWAVRVNSCKDTRVVSFRNNVWAGFGEKPILGIDKTNPTSTYLCTTAAASATTAATAESALTSAYPGITVAGNERLTSGVTIASLLGAWNEANANDLLASGWKLAPTATCAVAKGAGEVGGLLATDVFGAARTNPRSVGAAESDGPCQ